MRDLADPDIWTQSWFHDMLISGLINDGFSNDAMAKLREVLENKPVRSLAELMQAVRQFPDLPSEMATEISTALQQLENSSEFNRTCYLRHSPEQTRVIQWPNNPKTRVNDPAHHFGIFEDYFCRTPQRFITKQTRIGSAGSCFALRIAHQLQSWGYNYIIEEDDLPVDFPLDQLSTTNFRMAPARVGTLFNTPSMRQMVERAFGEWEPEKLVVDDNGILRDPFRSIKPMYSDTSGYEDDYQKHTVALREALLKCDVMILTLGLTEAWRFAHSNDFTSINPWQIEPSLLRATQLNVQQNVAELERLFEVYRRYNPDIRLIVSVSPVPLNKTFSQTDHVVVANSLSKATLRVAAEEFARNHRDSVSYFPSYEVVMYGTANPWEADMRHVSSDAVSRVMRLFHHMFFVDQTPLPMTMHQEPAHPTRPTIKGRIRRVLGPAMPLLRKIRKRIS